MDAGTEARNKTGFGGILALSAIQEIHEKRDTKDGQRVPKTRTAYILRSLKHPDEVRTLRRVYGSGFVLIGVYSPESARKGYLESERFLKPAEADELIRRDEHESELGQRMRDAFLLADVFIKADAPDTTEQIRRFLNLIFGHTCTTPTLAEHCMYLAYAASLRSGQLARQVGASIANDRGDVVATGANDVPRADGGLYWPGEDDRRDHILGEDSNDQSQFEIIDDVLQKLGIAADTDQARDARKKLESSKISEITEYSRAVHAEMEALLCCARIGVSTRGLTLYATTFPCHNCAKHIVAAGIKRVVYVEPYPKSRAKELHSDAIAFEDQEAEQKKDGTQTGDKVLFSPFVGVGPRRYLDVFSMSLGLGYPIHRKKDGRYVEWSADASARLRVPMLPTSYIQGEGFAVETHMTLTKETTEKEHAR